MKFLLMLARYSPPLFALIGVLSVLGGASNAALLGLISAELGADDAWVPANAWSFFLLLGLVFLTGYASRITTLYLTSRSGFDLRVSLCQQILALPCRDYEKIGESRVFAVLTQDVAAIGGTLLKIPELMVSIAIVTGCLVYLYLLAPITVAVLLVFMILLYMTYKVPMKRAERLLGRAREHWDDLVDNFKAISGGFKELKLHAVRRQSFLSQDLMGSAKNYRRLAFAGHHAYNLVKSWGKISFLLFIGFVLYGAASFIDLEVSVLTAFTLTLLYAKESVLKILDVIPELANAKVSMKKIEGYGLNLNSFRRNFELELPPSSLALRGNGASEFGDIRLDGVTHNYYHEREGDNFTLGPIDLTVNPGEILFVIGGNGSGKTTLAKIVAGLYRPESGQVLIGGKVVSEDTIEQYRQLFTVTFSDFFIFERLAGLETESSSERCREYLAKLQLDHKVEIKDGRFSTVKLSQGQRKRLVLLTAYLEDRPIYIFDEWAADQDPQFKEFFYLNLLQDLRAAGKTIIVISHDDRYYHLGDRMVKLEDGKLVSDTISQGAAVARRSDVEDLPSLDRSGLEAGTV